MVGTCVSWSLKGNDEESISFMSFASIKTSEMEWNACLIEEKTNEIGTKSRTLPTASFVRVSFTFN